MAPGRCRTLTDQSTNPSAQADFRPSYRTAGPAFQLRDFQAHYLRRPAACSRDRGDSGLTFVLCRYSPTTAVVVGHILPIHPASPRHSRRLGL